MLNVSRSINMLLQYGLNEAVDLLLALVLAVGYSIANKEELDRDISY